MKTKLLVAALALTLPGIARCQGSFVNLDFESPIVTWDPTQPAEVPITNALPGWTGYLGTEQTGSVAYNTVGAGGPAISLQGKARAFLRSLVVFP
jgi:hypothetical protein